MDAKLMEEKWQKYWKENNIGAFNEKDLDNKFYALQMFIYPSAARMHIGHFLNYGVGDSYGRFKKMTGKNVFQPMGYDAFGLPAENHAIKTNSHPWDNTYKNIADIERQFVKMGALYDWNYTLTSSESDYYKWTQWLFLELYKNGLAYQKEAAVNYCPKCSTVLANEQVVDGCCERCDTQVVQKFKKQWFFKITDYAEKLLTGLDGLNWPETTKTLQRNWIGKSEGSLIRFKCGEQQIEVFTTRADTIYGVSYIVLAPEHPLVNKITAAGQKAAVEAYVKETATKKEIERLTNTDEKTGVFTGAYAIHPLTGKNVPVYIADYCLVNYGTGAVMGVPAHDERDFEFAKKHKLLVSRVVAGQNAEEQLPATEYGILINSGEFDGLTSEQAKTKITEKLKSINMGEFKTTYRLRDWSVSRQRYWGAPIPVVYCEGCGAVPVPEKDLPVLLPHDVDFAPDGTPPLAKCAEFVNTTCPHCGKGAKREVETLDTFVCSSWYYLRYPSVKHTDKPFDKSLTNKMLPVDICIGGREHACGHLIYARFITKALHDLKYLTFDEPFTRLVHQGLILGPDGQKMSKRFGNVVNPDDYYEKHGSDALRFAMAFGFNYSDGGPWNDSLVAVAQRFFDKLARLTQKYKTVPGGQFNYGKSEETLDYVRNFSIKSATADIEQLQFNTALARFMELINALTKYEAEVKEPNLKLVRECVTDLVLGVAPFAPHNAEEWWQSLGNTQSVFLSKYPSYDESKLKLAKVNIMVQINSKNICAVDVDSDSSEDAAFKTAVENDKIKTALAGKAAVKKIYIKGRLLNIIVK